VKITRKIIQIDDELCDGCGNCVPGCAEGALQIIDGKARVVADKFCDGLGACIGDCPTGALKIIEREADDFDERAVEAHLASLPKQAPEISPTAPAGCPSANVEMLTPISSCEQANEPATLPTDQASALAHWPVQIRLVPPEAPFLKGASLLIVADCVPIAFPSLHRDFLRGKAVMMGCPKFDEVEMYIEKFAQIFTVAGIKDITAMVMEVPCCSGLPMIIQKGLEKAGKTIPMEEVVISTRGQILERRKVA
jgi:NAD-dependent dihydropyrimidine dehydrogenase PreA subunit